MTAKREDTRPFLTLPFAIIKSIEKVKANVRAGGTSPRGSTITINKNKNYHQFQIFLNDEFDTYGVNGETENQQHN